MKANSEEWWAARGQQGRCTGTSLRRSGRCRRAAISGGTVCPTHGGQLPVVKRAAAARVVAQTALQNASAMLAASGIPDRTPLEHLEAVLGEDARAFALWDRSEEHTSELQS